MSDLQDALEQPTQEDKLLQAIAQLSVKFDKLENRLDSYDAQFEAIRQGLADNSARFDQLEALALDGKSIALMTRSQLTILTEELRRDKLALK